MHEVVLRIAQLVLAVSLPLWLALSLVVLGGRVLYDRRQRVGSTGPNGRQVDRLLRRALAEPRTEWGQWRKISALNRLAGMRHPATPHVLYHALWGSDPKAAAAAIRALGALGDLWAIEVLVAALRGDLVPRSRVAAQLERLYPEPGFLLLPLLRDPDPAVRFWGATLIGPYEALGEVDLVNLTRDEDPNVRAAAVEALGTRHGEHAAAATVALLDDPEWFVRVHAARAAGHVAGAEAAPAIAKLLADERWWVRTAAKDALESLGRDAVPALVSVLSSPDRFARNGAAEVLQDIGLVDHLALEEPRSPLLAQIYEAGGAMLRQAAEERTARERRLREEKAA
jgi:HEAT repeats/PBS lyase HEAT-like repeat